jgi:hypothetical protein
MNIQKQTKNLADWSPSAKQKEDLNTYGKHILNTVRFTDEETAF